MSNRNGKFKAQKVVITLTDATTGGFDARFDFQPSLKGRKVSEDSPALNAAARLHKLIENNAPILAAPLEVESKLITPPEFQRR